MFSKLPLELKFKIATYLKDCVDLFAYFRALGAIHVTPLPEFSSADSDEEDGGEEQCPWLSLSNVLLGWFELLKVPGGGKGPIVVPIEINEESLDLEIWRRQNAEILLEPRVRNVDSLHETRVFHLVLDEFLEFILNLLHMRGIGSNVLLDLTVISAERSTRLTFRMLKTFFSDIKDQLVALRIITRNSGPPRELSCSTPPLKDLVPADGVYTPPSAQHYHVWNDDQNHWSPVSSTSPEIWVDSDTWHCLPSLPLLRHLHVSGPASIVWMSALQNVVTPLLEELVIQCWIGEGTSSDGPPKVGPLRDFIMNTCTANLRRLKIIVPPKYEILSPLVIKTAICLSHKTLESVSFVHRSWNRYGLKQVFPLVKFNQDRIISNEVLKHEKLDAEQIHCVAAMQQHLHTVSSILGDRSLDEDPSRFAKLRFNWLECGSWVVGNPPLPESVPQPTATSDLLASGSQSTAPRTALFHKMVAVAAKFPKAIHDLPLMFIGL
eukprot:Gregarina_sp_Poly_1__11449@NODE_97_length_14617_cov_146_063230_g84_i0_p4_GENE_NODE_97_length_14617_cov_146_063230_g84_i0NODE_97_length_14617_cov_146_063230_g84_i0_p4_ORF_typecomplete_len493_score62_00_NODE_97_length_14617_cov_146_063230_g84_i01167913157